ncbi:hypothetical protein GQX73_g223 [Xylaria multiplex]|uniref:BTB domain-containing protein n=1 Tax=Xylaria multiplex TaxID=323545 RepID=A0A7C8NEE6_9PEZI|nr:hypothetical protein GQX73_g223 [Xylaria multiplex]
MAEINPSMSNGSCWSNVNTALGIDYIPCGNVADGNSYACCRTEDNCLSSNACYNGKFGITYLAGCTTPDFSGPACQHKGQFVNQSWVGLTRCDPDQTSWAGCPEKDNVVGSEPPTANCKCRKDTILFQDKPTLDNIAKLPSHLGGLISWFPGHEPTTTIITEMPLTTSTQPTHSSTISSISSDSSLVSSPSTPTSTTTVPPAAGLSTGEKAGIAVGSALGAIAVGCLIFIAIVIYRRKATKKEALRSQPFLNTIEPDPTQPVPSAPSFLPLGGFKAELPADEPPSANTIAPSSVSSSPSPANSPNQLTTPRQYQPYSPGAMGNHRHSDVSQLSSKTQGYPESLISTPTPRIPDERRTGEADSISIIAETTKSLDIWTLHNFFLTLGFGMANVYEVLRGLFFNPRHSDLEIVCRDGFLFKVHRPVIALHSTILNSMVTQGITVSGQIVSQIQLLDVGFSTLYMMLEFFYSGNYGDFETSSSFYSPSYVVFMTPEEIDTSLKTLPCVRTGLTTEDTTIDDEYDDGLSSDSQKSENEDEDEEVDDSFSDGDTDSESGRSWEAEEDEDGDIDDRRTRTFLTHNLFDSLSVYCVASRFGILPLKLLARDRFYRTAEKVLTFSHNIDNVEEAQWRTHDHQRIYRAKLAKAVFDDFPRVVQELYSTVPESDKLMRAIPPILIAAGYNNGEFRDHMRPLLQEFPDLAVAVADCMRIPDSQNE